MTVEHKTPVGRRMCDCGHVEDAHSIRNHGTSGRFLSWWCEDCSCTRFNPADPADPDHDPNV